jgi:hypothetical protein
MHDDATWLLDFYDTFKDFVGKDVLDVALNSLANVEGRFGQCPTSLKLYSTMMHDATWQLCYPSIALPDITSLLAHLAWLLRGQMLLLRKGAVLCPICSHALISSFGTVCPAIASAGCGHRILSPLQITLLALHS